jgi:hypothetical protein
MKRSMLALLLGLLAAQALAVEKPKPAAPTAAPRPDADAPGTTLIGDQDSEVGLYLTPWKEEHADDLDPPPGLLDQTLQPIDGASFGRTVREAATVSAYRHEQMQRSR